MTATCVRVPVFIGHSEAVNVEFERPISVEQARDALRRAPGVTVVDHRADEGYVTPGRGAPARTPVFVSRIRKDPTVANGLNMWVVADNLRKGAALNAVQIAELLGARDHLPDKTGKPRAQGAGEARKPARAALLQSSSPRKRESLPRPRASLDLDPRFRGDDSRGSV